jgi:hypothetical protein
VSLIRGHECLFLKKKTSSVGIYICKMFLASIFSPRIQSLPVLIDRSTPQPSGGAVNGLLFCLFNIFFFILSHGVRLSLLATAATVWPIVQAQDDDDDCAAIGGMKIGRRNRNIRRKPAPMPLVQQKSHVTSPGLEPRPRAMEPPCFTYASLSSWRNGT